MRSMTGYGKGVANSTGKQITVEIKTVNNRYLDINLRLPRALGFLDGAIRKIIQDGLKRGNVEVYFNYEQAAEDSKTVSVDLSLAEKYVAAAKSLRTQFVLTDDFGVSALMRSPEVVTMTAPEDDAELIEKLTKEATNKAIDALNAMREVEGEGIKADLSSILGRIVGLLEKVILRAPEVVTEYRQKIKNRIEEILAGVAVDEARLLNETAFFADKADINEEISRLNSHIAQFTDGLVSDEPQGRKLDFLSQEMNREINTIGSKCNDSALSAYVVEMKNELEKIKEQIRNIE